MMKNFLWIISAKESLTREEELEMEGAEEDITKTKEHSASIGEKVQISLNSLMGLATLGTMKLKEEVFGKEVIVLIDCRATHNFISWDLVRRLGIPVVETTDFGVETRTGKSVQGMAYVKMWYLLYRN